MSKNFLAALGGAISDQFSLGENTNHTLDNIDLETGKSVKYGSLGDFAKHFDQSSERRYVEEGYLRIDPFTANPKQFEILMQEPNATVLVKKKMFSSIGDNFRTDFMNDDEKVYFKAMKVLFQNKCAQISALEKLSKIQKITESMGNVSEQLMPIIFSLSDTISNGLDSGSNLFGAFGGSSSPLQKDASNLTKTIDVIRRVYGFNHTNKVTSWITDSNNLFQSQFGQGTGVIEITNFTNLSTTTSTNIDSPGTFNITISDPYEAMLITEWDIEKAISDATNMFYNSKMSQFAKESSTTLINDITARLNKMRAARNASPISIKVAPDTLLGRRVTAILDRLGIELKFDYDSTSAESIFSGGAFGGGATIDPGYLKGGYFAGDDGLDPNKQKFGNIRTYDKAQKRTHEGYDSEVSLFSRLVSTIYSKLSQDANSQGAFVFNNQKTNYARRKLRFNLLGKLIVQPMDVVHIYLGSKSRYDNKLLSGMQSMMTGVGILQNVNNTITDFKNAASALFAPSANLPLQIEKSAFVGADFPNYLWSMVRGQFVTEKEGAHVFAGVVEGSSDSWTGGKFTVNITGKDNTYYFEQGQINFKPGADAFNGTFYDPLTPFVSNFDSVNNSNNNNELLEENKYLLGGTDANGNLIKGLVKSKLGRYAGTLVTDKHIISDRTIDPVTGRATKVFYAPDGLVYKWKEGIGIFTQTGSNLGMNDPNRVGAQNPAKEPFAGQDIMNVLSLLITGVPYNFATYSRSTQELNAGYAASLSKDLIKNNTLWGNFFPFKNLVLDEASYNLMVSTQTKIIGKNKEIDEMISKLSELNKQAMLDGAVNIFSEKAYREVAFNGHKADAKILQDQIYAATLAIEAENESYHKNKNGADISFDSVDLVDTSKRDASVSDGSIRKLIRRQLNFITRRMSYDVRANADRNLFIVDDTYDKDYDILAFEKALTKGLELYNDEFTSVKEKIGLTAKLLNLEVFCDSQGHIRVRSPQYNRMPSSVFYKMMHFKETLGIQVFPEFLNSLFKNKLETLKNRLEILEDQIRLDGAALNKNTDQDVIALIRNENLVSSLGWSFSFISDENGKITQIDNLISAANPDDKTSSGDIATYFKIERNSNYTQDIFTNTQRYYTIINSLAAQKTNAANADGTSTISTPYFINNTNTRVDDIIKRIYINSNIRIDKRDYLIDVNSDQNIVASSPGVGIGIDYFKVTADLSQKLREYQSAIKSFYNAIKNAQEFRYLDNKKNSSNALITAPTSHNNTNIPEVFEHMIEDETYDDYGVGSGSRFIIKRSQITSINVSESPPPATMIEVTGYLDSYNTPQGTGFNLLSKQGNGMTTAVAVDYDMWRNYGFKGKSPINVPFLNNPDTQCAPYAAMLLSRNRKDIFKGTVVIAGNEFMQPGEVVYIEDRGLLFYVTSVQHNFTFGGTFSTTLQLTYGHPAGEYIPTPMDMFGKIIYNNRDVANMVVHRQETSSNDSYVGTLLLAKTNEEDGGIGTSLGINQKEDSALSSYASANSKIINDIIYSTAEILNRNSNVGNDMVAKIELRTYYDSSEGVVDPTILNFAQKIAEIFSNPEMGGLNKVLVTKQGTSRKTMSATNIKDAGSTTVDLNNKNDRRSPSQKAIDAARNSISSSGPSLKENLSGLGQAVGNLVKSEATISDNKKAAGNEKIKTQQSRIRKTLFENIVDCFVTLEAVKKDKTGC
jgi:hypothetical protein